MALLLLRDSTSYPQIIPPKFPLENSLNSAHNEYIRNFIRSVFFMFKNKNFIFIPLLVIVAGIAGFFILKNAGILGGADGENAPADGISSAGDAAEAPDINIQEVENGEVEGILTPEEDARLRALMPDVLGPVVITANLPEETKNQARKEIKELADMINSNYNYLQAWLQLGILRKFTGDLEGARQAWEFAAILRPDNAVAFNNLGNLYGYYLQDYPKAEANYLKSIEKDPKNIDAYKSLAEIYQYSYAAKAGEADDILLRGIESNPQDPTLMVALARYYADIGNKEGAVTYYKRALDIDPSNKNAKSELAEIEKSV